MSTQVARPAKTPASAAFAAGTDEAPIEQIVPASSAATAVRSTAALYGRVMMRMSRTGPETRRNVDVRYTRLPTAECASIEPMGSRLGEARADDGGERLNWGLIVSVVLSIEFWIALASLSLTYL